MGDNCRDANEEGSKPYNGGCKASPTIGEPIDEDALIGDSMCWEMSKFGAPEDGDEENDGSGDSEDEDDEDDGSGDSEDEEDEESEEEEEEEEEEVCEDPKNFQFNGKKRNCRRFLTKQFNKKGKKKACKKFGKFCPKRCEQCE